MRCCDVLSKVSSKTSVTSEILHWQGATLELERAYGPTKSWQERVMPASWRTLRSYKLGFAVSRHSCNTPPHSVCARNSKAMELENNAVPDLVIRFASVTLSRSQSGLAAMGLRSWHPLSISINASNIIFLRSAQNAIQEW